MPKRRPLADVSRFERQDSPALADSGLGGRAESESQLDLQVVLGHEEEGAGGYQDGQGYATVPETKVYHERRLRWQLGAPERNRRRRWHGRRRENDTAIDQDRAENS